MAVVKIQNSSAQSKQIEIDLDKIPTAPYFIQLSNIQFVSEKASKIERYKEKIEIANTTLEKLEEAKDHCLRDKLVALLKTMLSVSLAATAIFALTTGAGAGSVPLFALYLVASLSFVITTSFFMKQAQEEIQLHEKLTNFQSQHSFKNKETWKDILPFLLFPVLGPFAPLYQAFTRIPRLEKAVDIHRAKREEIHAKGQKHLAKMIPYMQDHGNEIIQLFEGWIQKRYGTHAPELLKEDFAAVRAYVEFFQSFGKAEAPLLASPQDPYSS